MNVLCDRNTNPGDYGCTPIFLGLAYPNETERVALTLPLDYGAKLYNYVVQLEDGVLDITNTVETGGEYIEMPGRKMAGEYESGDGELRSLIIDPNSQDERVIVTVNVEKHTVMKDEVFEISTNHILFTNGRLVVRNLGKGCSTYHGVKCARYTDHATTIYDQDNTLSIIMSSSHPFAGRILGTRSGEVQSIITPLGNEILNEGGLVLVESVIMSYASKYIMVFAVTLSGRACLIGVDGQVEWIDVEGKCKEVMNHCYDELYVIFGREDQPTFEVQLRARDDQSGLHMDITHGGWISSPAYEKVRYDRPCAPRIKSSNS